MVFKSMDTLRFQRDPSPTMKSCKTSANCQQPLLVLELQGWLGERRRETAGYGPNAGDLDQGSPRHLRRWRRARGRGQGRQDRRTGCKGQGARHRKHGCLRCRRACRAAGPDQHTPPLLPNPDAGAAGGAGPRIVSMAAGALSRVGAHDAGIARPRGDAWRWRNCCCRAAQRRPTIITSSRPDSRTPSTSRSRPHSGSASACC